MAEQSAPVLFYNSTGKPLPRLPTIIRPGTSAAVFNERDEILLQKRADNGFWSMPGGAVDPGESVPQGALREVWEETGLRVRVVRLAGVYSDLQNYTLDTWVPCRHLPRLTEVIHEAKLPMDNESEVTREPS